MSQSPIELLVLLFLSFSATFPGEGEKECSLLLPACLKPLEMTDFCLFPLISADGGSKEIGLSPVAGEKVFLRRMDLALYEYPEGAEVAFTPDGRLFLLHAAEPPVAALDHRGNVVLEELRKRDGLLWGGGVMELLKGERGWVNLQFGGAGGSRTAVLLLEGEATKRSAQKISSYLLEGMRGTGSQEANRWPPNYLPGAPEEPKSSEQGRDGLAGLEKDREFIKKLRRWMREELALHVLVWNGQEWKEKAVALPWLSMRTVGFILDLTGVPSGEGLKVRIELPSSLWKINRVAMDFAPEGPIPAGHVSSVKPPNLPAQIDKRSQVTIALPSARGGHARAGLLSMKGYYHIEPPRWLP